MTSETLMSAFQGTGPPVDEPAWWAQFVREANRPAWIGGGAPSVRTVDLFSSVGGLTLGFGAAASQLGFALSSRAAVDIDEAALDRHAANFGTDCLIRGSASLIVDSVIHGRGPDAHLAYPPAVSDARIAGLVGEVDAVLAGPPCQGHSNLNNHTRRDDPRNELYLVVPAAAIALEAPIVIIENVPEVTAARSDVVRTALAVLDKAGYSTTSGVVRATDLGWPQTRRRFFIVATMGWDPVPLADIVAEYGSKAPGVGALLGDLLDRPADSFMDEMPELTERNAERIRLLFEEDLFDLPNHARPDCHKNGTTYGATYGRMKWDAPAPTITTGFATPGRGRFIHPLRPRVLSPREAARIQGFPDWFSFGNPAAPPTRSQLTKWIGNAVPSPLGFVAGISALLQRGSSGRL